MGNSNANALREEQLREMENATHKTWTNLLGIKESDGKVEAETICEKIKVLQVNPFRRELLYYFSSTKNRENIAKSQLCFADFLDLCSAFSVRAPLEIKIHVAFHLLDNLDSNTDHKIRAIAMEKLVERLINDKLSVEATRKVFQELNIEGDIEESFLEYDDFVSCCKRVPDFEKYVACASHRK